MQQYWTLVNDLIYKIIKLPLINKVSFFKFLRFKLECNNFVEFRRRRRGGGTLNPDWYNLWVEFNVDLGKINNEVNIQYTVGIDKNKTNIKFKYPIVKNLQTIYRENKYIIFF